MRRTLPGVLIAVFVVLVATALVATAPAFAHHGFTTYFDHTKCFTMTGIQSGIIWENPHAYVKMDVKDASGKTVQWRLEMVTPNALRRNGSPREAFLANEGKSITARACPIREGGTAYAGAAEYLKLSDGLLRIVGQNMEKIEPAQLGF